MSWRDIGAAGGAGGVAAAGADVLVNGGEALVWLVAFLADQGPLLYLLFARLARVAPDIEWLPAEVIERGLIAVALLVAAVALFQIARNFVRRWRTRDES